MISGLNQAQVSIQAFSGAASNMLSRLAALGAGLGAGGILGFGIKLAADLEKAHVAFEVMLGSADKATKVLNDLRSFADVTPFEFADLKEASNLLIAANVAAEDILPTLSMLGDVSQGDAAKLQLVAKAYTDVINKGRLQGQEIRQFAENGVPLLAQLAAQFGVTKQEIVKMSEAGEIGFADVQKAIVSMVQEGGNRFGMMEKQSQTLSGRWSTLIDTAKRLATDIGEMLMPAAKNLVEMFVKLVGVAKQITASLGTNTVKIVALGVAWTTMVTVGVKVVAIIGSIVKALRGMATAQAITQALSGPKGWAQLAIGVAAAAASFALIDSAFAKAEAGMAGTSAVAADAKAGIERLRQEAEKAPNMRAAAEAEKAAEEQEKAAKKQQHRMEQIQRHAEQVRKEMRTPAEEVVDQVKEMQALFSQGLISESTFSNGIRKARDEFQKTIKDLTGEKLELAASIDFSAFKGLSSLEIVKSDIQEMVNAAKELQKAKAAAEPAKPVGAASRFTQEGFSAVQEGNRQLSAQLELRRIADKQLVEQQRANAILAEIKKNTAQNPVQLGVADL